MTLLIRPFISCTHLISFSFFDFWPFWLLCYWCSVSHQQSVTHTNGADTIFRLDPYTDKSFSYFLFLKTLQSPPLVKEREKKESVYYNIIFVVQLFTAESESSEFFLCCCCSFQTNRFFFLNRMIQTPCRIP